MSDAWTSVEWKAAHDKAAAYAARDRKWVVGPAKVRMLWLGYQRALEAERAG